MIPRVKICCIQTEDEAKMAIEYGASAIGLVGKMPSGPGPIDDQSIRRIARSIPPPIATFLLTGEINASSIAEHHKRTSTNTIQIVDIPQDETHSYLEEKLPNVKRVQVIHVVDDNSVEEAALFFDKSDALLLDSGNPNLKVKELGGTGRVHNWKISRKIVDISPIPVFLAGGLNAENVKEAMDTVQPFGLDVCSGVRTRGLLDPQKLEEFMKAALQQLE